MGALLPMSFHWFSITLHRYLFLEHACMSITSQLTLLGIFIGWGYRYKCAVLSSDIQCTPWKRLNLCTQLLDFYEDFSLI